MIGSTLSSPIRIVIADTAFIIRKGLKELIHESPNFEFAGEVTHTEGLYHILETNHPQILIVDHCCEDCFSIEVIRGIKIKYPSLRILVISHEKSIHEIRKVLSIGIKNYLLKDCNEREILDALKACALNEKFICSQILDTMMEHEFSEAMYGGSIDVSKREMEIIRWLSKGKRPKEISDILNISALTVTTHKRNIYRKLKVTNGVELAQFAHKKGWLN